MEEPHHEEPADGEPQAGGDSQASNEPQAECSANEASESNAPNVTAAGASESKVDNMKQRMSVVIIGDPVTTYGLCNCSCRARTR